MTIYEIAERCGVSIATVSRALNDRPGVSPATKAKILRACQDVSYRPTAIARGLTLNRSWTIGVVFRHSVNHILFQDIFSAFQDAADQSGYDLLFLNHHDSENDAEGIFERARYRGVDGLLVTGLAPSLRLRKLIDETGIPCVAINAAWEGARMRYVMSDNYGGAQIAARLLFDYGHRDVAVIGHASWAPVEDRTRGFVDTARELGLSIRAGWNRVTDWTEEAGYDAARSIWAMPKRPTAVFCVSDLQALGVIRAVSEIGLRIGQDVSVVGFDDIILSRYIHPGLTTIGQDKKRLGVSAAELLVELIDSGVAPSSITVPTYVAMRESLGPNPAQSLPKGTRR